jgi:hypothetical protein
MAYATTNKAAQKPRMLPKRSKITGQLLSRRKSIRDPTKGNKEKKADSNTLTFIIGMIPPVFPTASI